MPENIEPFALPIPVEGDVPDIPHDMKVLAERLSAIFKGRLLSLASHVVSFAAASGEMVKATATLTVTLPAPAVDATIGVICAAGETTIKMTGAKIFGDFITGAEEIKLLINQHVVLQSDGTNWYIVAGEPMRTGQHSGFSAKTLAELHAGFIPSATRPTEVHIKLRSAEATWGAKLEVNGKVCGWALGGAGAVTFSVYVPPGQTVKVDKDEPFGEKLAAGVTAEVSTLLL